MTRGSCLACDKWDLACHSSRLMLCATGTDRPHQSQRARKEVFRPRIYEFLAQNPYLNISDSKGNQKATKRDEKRKDPNERFSKGVISVRSCSLQLILLEAFTAKQSQRNTSKTKANDLLWIQRKQRPSHLTIFLDTTNATYVAAVSRGRKLHSPNHDLHSTCQLIIIITFDPFRPHFSPLQRQAIIVPYCLLARKLLTNLQESFLISQCDS